MPKIFLGLFLLSLLLTSCKNKEQEKAEVNTTAVSESSVIKSDKPISRLNAESKKLVAPWGEYQKFDDLISQYQEISMNEALLNSVAKENNNIIEAFSALNLKINNMSSQDQLNSEISKFVDEILEQPKTDSIGKEENP